MLHQESPAVEFWCLFGPEQREPWRSYAIPKEIDAILLDCSDILAQPDVSLHLYGKLETRPGRKMGHVTRVFAEPPQGG